MFYADSDKKVAKSDDVPPSTLRDRRERDTLPKSFTGPSLQDLLGRPYKGETSFAK